MPSDKHEDNKMTVTAADLWWERLRNRDASEAGSFVYGVVTTGI